MQENGGPELGIHVLQVRSDQMIVMIALKYDNDQDGEKLVDFWQRYLHVLPMTGLMGLDEAKYEHGVSLVK